MREFLKSCSELLIKKYEEFHKFFTTNFFSALDSQLKDIFQDEILWANLNTKFLKELNSFKINFTKFQQISEKCTQNVQTAKDMIINSNDDNKDVNLFQRLEKALISCINEEEIAKENVFDCIKKFKKFFEENFENLKKNIEIYKKKETLKNKEIKELMINLLNQKNTLINHLLEFFQFKSQISFDKDTLIKSIIEIFMFFFKENGFNFFEEKEFADLVSLFYGKNQLENLENPLEKNENQLENFENLEKKQNQKQENLNNFQNLYNDDDEIDLKKLIIIEENIPNSNITFQKFQEKMKFLKFDEKIFLRKNEDYFKNESFNLTMNINDFKEFYEKFNFLKSNSRKISIRNIIEPNRKIYMDLFYYDNDEIVNENNYSCALSHKILLQGKIYVTNKKIVFHSYFNNMNLFGTTLIEIPKSDILDMKKKYNMIFDNSIEITTKNVVFFFTSFIYRDIFYSLVKEVLFGEIVDDKNSNYTDNNKKDVIEIDLSSNGGNPNEERKNEENNNINNINTINNNINNNNKNDENIFINDINKNDINSPSINSSGNNDNIRENKNQSKSINTNNINSNNSEMINIDYNSNNINNLNNLNNLNNNNNVIQSIILNPNPNNELNRNKNNQIYITKDIFNEKYKKILDTYHEKNLNNYKKHNNREFNLLSVKNKEIGDIPLPYIYNILFNTNYICEELNLNKSFNLSIMEIQTDHHIEYKNIYNNEPTEKQIPYIYNENLRDNKEKNKSFFENFKNSTDFISLFIEDFNPDNINFSQEELNKVIDKDKENKINKNFQSYKYTFIHPILKKRFMGPSQLNIDNIFKIYFISPKCLIVDKYSYMSGFMYMDCFYSITQYKFESEISFVNIDREKEGNLNESNFEVIHNTKYSISFGMEFVKNTMFKQKILDNAILDNDEFIKENLVQIFDKVFLGTKEKYIKEKILFKSRNTSPIINSILDLNSELNYVSLPESNRNIANINEMHKFELDNKDKDKDRDKEKENEIRFENNNNNNDNNVDSIIKENEGFIEDHKLKLPHRDLLFLLEDYMFNLFILLGLVLFIIYKFGYLDSSSMIFFLNFIGFVIVFVKVNKLENRLNEIKRK
jgi:hypothetical protein